MTEPLQLPADFLNPSPEKKLVIGFDCEGVDLCRHGKLCIMQVWLIETPHTVYFVQLLYDWDFVFGRLHSLMRYTWLMSSKVERCLWKRVSLHSSLLTSQKSFTIANVTVRCLNFWLVVVVPRGISLDFITACLLTIILFSVLQALYFQFGIRLHNVVDTQVRFNSLASRLYSCLGKNLDLVFFFCFLLQIAFSLIEEQEGRRRPLDDYI